MAEVQTVFRPHHSELLEYPELGVGWRIGAQDSDDVWIPDRKDLKFARKLDCELAIRALTAHGITTEAQIDALGDDELCRIACSDLQW